jgi:hypothetical protein
MTRPKKTAYRARGVPVAGDSWADRFYYPMPSPPPVPYLVAAWEGLADWAKEYALAEQARTKGGKPPVCPDCKQDVITYPFHAVESYEGVWCRECHYKRSRRESETHAQAG